MRSACVRLAIAFAFLAARAAFCPDLVPEAEYQDGDGNRYQVLGQLGQGGRSQVYRARNVATGEIVVIKDFNDAEGAAESQRGVAAMRPLLAGRASRDYFLSVTHTTFQRVGGRPGQQPVQIMPLAEGDLASLIPRLALDPARQSGAEMTQNLNRQLFYFDQMTAAWLSLGREGVAHRDIKPQNFLVFGDRVRLADYDVATRMGTESRAAHMGTRLYQPPEVMREVPFRQITSTADLYALSATMFECLTGKTIFANAGHRPTTGMQVAVLVANPTSLADIRNKAAATLDALIDAYARSAVADPAEREYNVLRLREYRKLIVGGLQSDPKERYEAVAASRLIRSINRHLDEPGEAASPRRSFVGKVCDLATGFFSP